MHGNKYTVHPSFHVAETTTTHLHRNVLQAKERNDPIQIVFELYF